MAGGAVRVLAGLALTALSAALLMAGPPAAAEVPAAPPRLMTWPDLLNRPKPALKPERLRYGDDPNQVIDLWRPTTPGPHPVIAMIHGGCWQAEVASLHIMDWAAADLAQRGVAVWNIEYRRVDQPGGGHPGTFNDVAAATDKLSAEAAQRGLRTGDGLVVLGHSAGGHLALWTAARRAIWRQYALSQLQFLGRDPPKVRAVVDIAGIPDLEHDTDTACGAAPIDKLVAPSGPEHWNKYGDVSPAHMLPIGAEIFVIHGAQDTTVKPEIGARFAAKAKAAGDRVTVLTPPGGHTEEISPGTAAWDEIAKLVLRLSR